MKIYKKSLISIIFATFLFLGATDAKAMIPTLSLTQNGADNVLVTVSGDQNSSVTLYYSSTYGVLQNRLLGYTSYNGFFSATISGSSYGIASGSQVYVIVNGQQSTSVSWPSYSGGSLYLSQTNLSLSLGQTSSVTAYNTSGTLYVSSNSNSNVALANIIGNAISIYANAVGNSTIVVCQNIGSSVCATLYVTVATGSTNIGYSNLIVSNLALSVGNSATLSFSNSGGIFLSTNSNPNVASASYATGINGCTSGSQYSVLTGQPCYVQTIISNTSVVITALSPGFTTITLCQGNSTNFCSSVTVTVTGSIQPYYPIDYSPIGGACYLSSLLRYGMTGAQVYCLQSLLLQRGYLSASTSLNSNFDGETLNAVISFQRDNYLVADGIVGRNTRTKLNSY